MEYEAGTGVGDKAADFRIHGDPIWTIEVVSLCESDAVKEATRRTEYEGIEVSSLFLHSTADDKKHTEEGEMVRAIEKIAEKAQKFPPPMSDSYHVILADVRGYIAGLGDSHDYRGMVFGVRAVEEPFRRFWNNQPVRGIFDPANDRASARLALQRVHFIGIVNEKKYSDGETEKAHWFLNPALFDGEEAARHAFASFPLKRSQT